MQGQHPLNDITNQRFGRLIALSVAESPNPSDKLIYWKCKCDCGKETITRGTSLRQGVTKSCGCLVKEITAKHFTKHGQAKLSNRTTEYKMWVGAKLRARHKGLPFDIEPSDIKIPEYCPVLGIKLECAKGRHPQPQSPSLDRIHPEFGYVRGNILVISHRANTLKRDATEEELTKVLKYVHENCPYRFIEFVGRTGPAN